MNYGDLIGREYKPPFGCFELVREIMRRKGYDIPNYAETVPEDEKAEALRKLIAEHCRPQISPEEGDIVMIRWGGQHAHIGVMINDSQMIHALERIGAHISDAGSAKWRRRIIGYWRPDPSLLRAIR